MPKTRYMENKLLSHTFTAISYTAPTIVYVSLLLGLQAPILGVVNELANGILGYLRQPISSSGWLNAGSGSITNNAIIAFPAALGVWGNIVGIGIWDAATSGNLMYYNTISSQSVGLLDTIKFVTGSLTITES